MSQQHRSGLEGLKKPLVRKAPVVSLEAAEAAVLAEPHNTDVQTAVHTATHTEVPSDVTNEVPESLRRRRDRQPLIAWTFRIPADLHDELRQIAAFHRLTMSEIVIEAIQVHLEKFPKPAEY